MTLTEAIKKNNYLYIEELLENCKVDPFIMSDIIYRWACIKGHISIVKRYLKYYYKNKNNIGGMLEACAYGQLNIVKILINAGVCPINGDNMPIVEAAANGHLHVVKYLLKDKRVLKYKSDLSDIRDIPWESEILCEAIENDHFNVIEELLTYDNIRLNIYYTLVFSNKKKFKKYIDVNKYNDKVEFINRKTNFTWFDNDIEKYIGMLEEILDG